MNYPVTNIPKTNANNSPQNKYINKTRQIILELKLKKSVHHCLVKTQ
jgi:hypothetical protein